MTNEKECIGILSQNSILEKQLNLPYDSKDVHVCWSSGYEHEFRLKIKTHKEMEIFLKEWSERMNVIWRVNKTDPYQKASGLKNIYWKEFRCEKSNTKVSKNSKRIHKKHTDCRAKLTVTIKNVVKRCRSNDVHMPQFPAVIRIHGCHNHQLTYHDYAKQRAVSDEIKQKFIEMYKRGHTPVSALKLHKTELQAEHGDLFKEIVIDRSMCPDLQWCYRLMRNTFRIYPHPLPQNEFKDIDMEDEYSHDEVISSIEEIIVDMDEKPERNELMSPMKSNDDLEERAIAELSMFTEYVLKKLPTSSEVLTALTIFNEKWRSFTSDTELTNALRSFGQPN